MHSLSKAISAVIFYIMLAGIAHAQDHIVLEVGKAQQLQNIQKAGSIFIADPEIADVSSSPGGSQYVYGKQPGETTLIATDVAGKTLFTKDVIIIHDLSRLQSSLRRRYPSSRISLSSAKGSVSVSGKVQDELTHQSIIGTLRSSVPDSAIIDEIAVEESKVVRLDIKLIGVDRTRLERYGVNWSDLVSVVGDGLSMGQRGPSDLMKALDLMLSDGSANIVCSNTLVTVDNKKGEFTLGGDPRLPIYSSGNKPVNNLRPDLRFNGFHMAFLPILLPSGRVSLDLTGDFSVPSLLNDQSITSGFSSQSFSTAVELFNGESMIIAGMSFPGDRAAVPRHHPTLASFFGYDRSNELEPNVHRDFIIAVTPHFKDIGPAPRHASSHPELRTKQSRKVPARRAKSVHTRDSQKCR
ncbi:pilus assembly protein N-terminal domain-containing protein [Brucella intermedia]|uniref:pilus assembly protein N-terminal domain-containing protein n=1 Tax=Brucella intermedia TaxID=94625 RepID=UPI00235E939B|nr:pilus assembly protein N-terminal domain-containing protein [Brucella intermedia]